MSINTLSLGSKVSEPMNKKVNIASVAVRKVNHTIRLPQTPHEKCVKITICLENKQSSEIDEKNNVLLRKSEAEVYTPFKIKGIFPW